VTTTPQRILLIRPSALGDVCRSTPVLATLRAAFPAARIDWLVRDIFADAVRAHPALTGVVEFPRRDLARWWTPTGMGPAWRWLRSLREPRYDTVIDLQGLARSGLFALATRAPRRIGAADAAEFAHLAYTRRVRVDPSAHVVERALTIARALGAEPVHDPRLSIPPQTAHPEPSLRGASAAVFAPTSAWPGKRWPAERFAVLARRLLDTSAVERIAVVGAESERASIAPVLALARRESRVVDLVGRTTVAELMRVIESAALVVANDSAAMHVAVGLDRPLVALLGPTDPDLAGPWRRPDTVVQRAGADDRLTHRACKDAAYGALLMRRISVDDAFAKAIEQLHHADTGSATGVGRSAGASA